jgi:hypothetical protein
MEVKEVFSSYPPIHGFPLFEGLKAPGTELTSACENRASSLFI